MDQIFAARLTRNRELKVPWKVGGDRRVYYLFNRGDGVLAVSEKYAKEMSGSRYGKRTSSVSVRVVLDAQNRFKIPYSCLTPRQKVEVIGDPDSFSISPARVKESSLASA